MSIFRFLDLPPELRIHVYEALLVDAHAYIIPMPNLRPGRPNRSKSLWAAILRVSRLVYREASPVLYGYNTWMIRTFPLVDCKPGLVAYIGRQNAGLIRRVFTVNRLGGVGTVAGGLDEGVVKERYGHLGIKWERLQVWAVRNAEDGVADSWVEHGGGWLEKADAKKMRELGLVSSWWDFGHGNMGYWVVKKGSVARGWD
ncbi:hypothetical protein EJ04DRAFT_30987 [Polyplosphaeria fusca]|uniref:Uncharacterized protein n=1 Tax=Polyplosphaeria fusca TaxID=682080 RepID=A0A9P4UXV8_9PLEO|nr:hypothetical protein EJ04DRAFT_30987 [Polyplosphaeria fusca]